MAEAAIPVDLFNPGQVFACIGLAEAADVLLGSAEAVFDWSDPGHVVFRVRAQGDESPVTRVLAFLDEAEARAVAPNGSATMDAWRGAWGQRPKLLDRDAGYPFPDPKSPETLVCELDNGTCSIRIEHWGDATERDKVKFWAGAAGYPGAARIRDALERVRGRLVGEAVQDPFALAASTEKKSSVRLDWRRDYIPIDLGFSLNEHGDQFLSNSFPVVEVLGAVGLNNTRPRRLGSLLYDYCVVGRDRADSQTWLSLALLRSALGSAQLPWPTRRFRARLGRPNDYDRTFTAVTEENIE